MNPLFEPPANLGAAMLRVLVAALAGGLIGVERERSQSLDQDKSVGGARTFPLLAVLGASLTVVSGGVGVAVIAGFIGVAGLVVASYIYTVRRVHPGTTTEIAAYATYWIGVMAGAGSLVLAGAIAVGTAVLLASKKRLEGFSRALSQEELSAVLTLAVLAAVILPVLPDAPMGPWGVWNPRKLWLVVVLVCGLSFAAFIAMRAWGTSRGLYVSGLLGGLVSSTAATISLATRSAQESGHDIQLAVAAGMASLIMVVRVAILTMVQNREVALHLLPFLGVVLTAGAIPILVLLKKAGQSRSSTRLQNPFRLRTALGFAVIFGVVQLVVEAAKRQFGASGLVIVAALAGITDVDAITLALASSSGLSLEQSAGGIAVAALSNTAAKLGYVQWFGRGKFRAVMWILLGVAFLAGAVAILLVGPRPWSHPA